MFEESAQLCYLGKAAVLAAGYPVPEFTCGVLGMDFRRCRVEDSPTSAGGSLTGKSERFVVRKDLKCGGLSSHRTPVPGVHSDVRQRGLMTLVIENGKSAKRCVIL